VQYLAFWWQTNVRILSRILVKQSALFNMCMYLLAAVVVVRLR